MEQFDIYKDISERTDGDIYIGVVGPVRAGKSTFITNFMTCRLRWLSYRRRNRPYGGR